MRAGLRIDTQPTPMSLRAGGEPHRADGCDDGIFCRFRHRRATEAMADIAGLVREDGQMTGCLFEAGEFKCGISRCAFA